MKVLGLSNWREGRHGVTRAGKPTGGTDLEGKIRVQFWTRLLIRYPSAAIKTGILGRGLDWRFKESAYLSPLGWVRSPMEEVPIKRPKGLSPERKEQKKLRSRRQTDQVQGLLGFAMRGSGKTHTREALVTCCV